MVLQSEPYVPSGKDWRLVQEKLIRQHDFFKGKKIIAMKQDDLNWYVTVVDNSKKYRSSLYIVHLYSIATQRLSPYEVEEVERINWILKRKRDGYHYSWSINGQSMKNVEQVYYEDEYAVVRKMRGVVRVV